MSAQEYSIKSSVVRLKGESNSSFLLKSYRDSLSPSKGQLLVLTNGEKDVCSKIVEVLKLNHFQSPEGSVLAILKTAISDALLPINEPSSLSILACVFLEKYVYVCGWGVGSVVLLRNEKIVPVFSGRSGTIGSCSGSLQKEDLLLLTSHEFNQEEKEVLGHYAANNLTLEDFAREIKEENAAYSALVRVDDIKINEVKPSVLIQKDLTEPILPQTNLNDEPKTITFQKSWLVRLAEKIPEKNPFAEKASLANPSRTRKTAVSAGIILLVLLLISIIFGALQKKKTDFKSTYQQELIQAQNNYTNSLAQKNLNPEQSRLLFVQAKTTVDSLLSQGIKDPQVDDLKNKLQNDSASVLGKIEVTPQVFLDLTLVRDGVSAQEFSSDGKTLGILDGKGKRIIFVDLVSKQTGVTGGAEKLANAKTLLTANGKFDILTDGGLISITKQGDVSTLITRDDHWGEIVRVGSYGGNFYLVDKIGSIWRYASGSSERQDWLKSSLDLSQAKDLTIDGTLWVLAGDKIIQLVRGQQQNFAISNLDTPFSQPVALYTDETLDNIFVLDPQNKRVVELDKKGNYVLQYQSDLIGGAKDIVVSQSSGKIFLLTETKVLELPLK